MASDRERVSVIEPQGAAMLFVPTDAATISDAECAKCGNFCRAREADERRDAFRSRHLDGGENVDVSGRSPDAGNCPASGPYRQKPGPSMSPTRTGPQLPACFNSPKAGSRSSFTDERVYLCTSNLKAKPQVRVDT